MARPHFSKKVGFFGMLKKAETHIAYILHIFVLHILLIYQILKLINFLCVGKI
jgi:hypothetical protein